MCSSADRLELTVPVNLGVGRPRDKITAVVFAHALLSSGFLVNTVRVFKVMIFVVALAIELYNL